MSEQPVNRLVHFDSRDYGGSFTADLLEQYKLYVQSAENVSSRRIASSRYLLTLNVALVAFVWLSIGELRSDVLDVACSCLGDSGLHTLAPNHQITSGPQHGKVRADTRA